MTSLSACDHWMDICNNAFCMWRTWESDAQDVRVHPREYALSGKRCTRGAKICVMEAHDGHRQLR
jgi:hypothetical protein